MLEPLPELHILRKQKVFLGKSEKDVTDQIVGWVMDNPSVLILNKTILPKISFAGSTPGEKLTGSGDWEAIVEYEDHHLMLSPGQVARPAKH